jgi:Spy/CpxP family protein refolding chaperone
MNKNKFAKSIALAGVVVLLSATPGRAQSAAHNTLQTSKPASSRAQSDKDAQADVFAGLSYTDEQKAAIDKIHQETDLRRDAVRKDDKLAAEQKDAMLVGYSRMEFGFIYKVLSPEQQRVVRERIRARRVVEQGQKKQLPSG